MQKTQEIIDRMEQGRIWCKRHKDLYFEDNRMYFVFLFSENMDINYYTVYFLPLFRKEKNIPKFVIVSADPAVGRMVEEKVTVPHTFVLCTQEDRENIGTYFLQGAGKAYERAVINASNCKAEKKILEVIGHKGITAEEIVALAVYSYKETPKKEDVDNALKVAVPLYDKIDWEKYNFVMKDRGDATAPMTMEQTVDYVLDALTEEGKITKSDKLIVFSVTKTSRYIISKLQAYNIVAVLDNNSDLSGTFCEGIPVFSPEAYLNGKNPEDYKIIVPTRSYKAICEQLYTLGYEIDRQVFITYRELPSGSLRGWEKSMERGECTYDKIRGQYPDTKIYLAPYPGTGDMYLIGMYLRERMKHDNIAKCILVVSSQNCKRILSLFGLEDVVKEIIVLKDQEEGKLLLYFAQGYGYDKANLTVLNDGYSMLHMQPFRGLRGLDFNTMFQKVVFYAPERITYFDIRKQSADSLFEKYGLQRGKTVLLSPYANTIAQMPAGIWEQIAAELTDRGYDVCTNISGDEQPIKGTLGLFIPYTQIVDFLDKAGGFIAFRSGLCDIVSGTTAQKVILYPPEKIFYNTTNYDYFSLELMGLSKDRLHEINLSQEMGEELIKKILQTF